MKVTNRLEKTYDLETGNKIINNYMILKEIGRGVYGKVKLARNIDTQELVAVKIVDKKVKKKQLFRNLNNEEKLKREILILKKCNHHPNIVKLFEIIELQETTKIYLILEFIEKGEIEWRDCQEQPVLNANDARKIFRDIIKGLHYLHMNGIIHRDIKPSNILLSSTNTAKIADFGVSYYNPALTQAQLTADQIAQMDRELSETQGTPAFFAPELCSNQLKYHLSKSIDIWALGVTLYCFIFGKCPFIAKTEFELFDIIPNQPLTFPEDAAIDSDLEDLLTKLLEKNPNQRITLDQVKIHPWVVQDVDNMEEWLGEFTIKKPQTSESTTIMNRIRQSIKRFSFTSFNSTPNTNGSGSGNRRLSYQPMSNNTAPLYSNSSKPTVSLSTGQTLVINNNLKPISNYLSDEDTSSIEELTVKRPNFSRTASSTSSIGLTFGKFRHSMTPME